MVQRKRWRKYGDNSYESGVFGDIRGIPTKVGNQMLMSANEKGRTCKCKNKTVRWGNEMSPYIWMTIRTVTNWYDTSCKISSDIYKRLRWRLY